MPEDRAPAASVHEGGLQHGKLLEFGSQEVLQEEANDASSHEVAVPDFGGKSLMATVAS